MRDVEEPKIYRVKNTVEGRNGTFKRHSFYLRKERSFDRMTFTIPATERKDVRHYLNDLSDVWFQETKDASKSTSSFLLSTTGDAGFAQFDDVVERFGHIAVDNQA